MDFMSATLGNWIKLLRPYQWVKNFFVLAALVFSKQLLQPQSISRALFAFAVFCVLGSAVYILNDLCDQEEDRNHPIKKDRPLASGVIKSRNAIVVMVFLFAIAFTGAFLLNRGFGIAALAYAALNLLYSFWLKRIVLIDIMTVAANYVIRVFSGALAIGAPITPWLLIASTLLALFLVLGKRRHELVMLGDGAENHRAILKEYSPYFLDQLISIVTASTVVMYSLYTMDHGVQQFLGTHLLPLTIPFVLFGIFRYLYLIHQRREGGNPTMVLLTDKVLIVDVLLWTTSLYYLIYIL